MSLSSPASPRAYEPKMAIRSASCFLSIETIVSRHFFFSFRLVILPHSTRVSIV